MSEYTLDTNILINLERRYPRDIFPGVWEAVELLADEQRGCICREVLEELTLGGDNLQNWAKTLNGFVCEVTDDEVTIVVEISAAHPDWVQGQRNAADPWLIAHASVSSRTIVTEETRAGAGVIDANQKVPNVATEHQVETLTFFEFARAEGWSFG